MILSKPASECQICGSPGKVIYQDLYDNLYGVPGKWNIRKCKNNKCNLIWLDPKPLEKDLWKTYINYHTHYNSTSTGNSIIRRLYKYIKEGYYAQKFGYNICSISIWQKILSYLIYLHPIIKHILNSGVRSLYFKTNGKLLEIGCGNGKWLNTMRHLGWKVIGIDTDPSAVKNCLNKGIPTRLGKLESQNFPDNHFDVIGIINVIEHIYDPMQLLKECYRILKPGALLVLLTPNNKSWGHKIFKNNWRGLEIPRHLYVFNRNTLNMLFLDSEFEIELIRTQIDAYYYIISQSYALKDKIPSINGQIKLGALKSIVVKIITYLEFIILLLNKDIGENVFLIAKKPK